MWDLLLCVEATHESHTASQHRPAAMQSTQKQVSEKSECEHGPERATFPTYVASRVGAQGEPTSTWCARCSPRSRSTCWACRRSSRRRARRAATCARLAQPLSYTSAPRSLSSLSSPAASYLDTHSKDAPSLRGTPTPHTPATHTASTLSKPRLKPQAAHTPTVSPTPLAPHRSPTPRSPRPAAQLRQDQEAEREDHGARDEARGQPQRPRNLRRRRLRQHWFDNRRGRQNRAGGQQGECSPPL